MSLIIAKGEQITRSANNTSKSNQMFSFGVGKRFSQKITPQTQNFYDLPSSFHPTKEKGCSMGKGRRSSFIKDYTDKEKTAKTFYYKDTTFLGKSCTSFGKPPLKKSSSLVFNSNVNMNNTSSQNIPSTSGIHNPVEKNKYSKGTLGWEIKLKGKEKSYFDVKTNNVPGPGYYPVHNSNSSFLIKESGKISRTSNFSRCTSLRFKQIKSNGVPGPVYSLDYGNVSSNVMKYQKQAKSKVGSSKNSPNVSITNTGRLNFSKDQDQYPGPGQYQRPSDFGLYQSRYTKDRIIFGFKKVMN
mmetsp:Transcript_13838/g.14389  ORF Transcript_13838/g.14389 Transcript_13838/m.14389 type:complete len:298 (+) Transcript_13838:3-896(+)